MQCLLEVTLRGRSISKSSLSLVRTTTVKAILKMMMFNLRRELQLTI